jgi:hypothetical protein
VPAGDTDYTEAGALIAEHAKPFWGRYNRWCSPRQFDERKYDDFSAFFSRLVKRNTSLVNMYDKRLLHRGRSCGKKK